jgi:3-deoxy-manno-octulosonate cytidylyltransferase (CMP-KDO synthetase)
MSVLVIVPARYASSRYPGKPLVALKGATGEAKTLIRRSWDAAVAAKGVDRVVVATDDDRIAEHAKSFGAEVVMTDEDCANGTERCADALSRLGEKPEIVVNLQGDAPLTPSWFVENLIAGLRADEDADLATPVLRCDGKALSALLLDRKSGRVGGTTAVFGSTGDALYFSKEVIPFTSKLYLDDEKTPVFHHVGLYAYRPGALRAYVEWPVGPLETLEGLEQLRFVENGKRVLCVEVNGKGRSFWELNNPEDVPRIEGMLKQMGQQ